MVRVFEKYGPVEKALVMIQKSHGFVQFANIDDAKKCLAAVGVDQAKEVREDKVENAEMSEAQNQAKGASKLYLNNKELLVSSSHRSEITVDRVE